MTHHPPSAFEPEPRPQPRPEAEGASRTQAASAPGERRIGDEVTAGAREAVADGEPKKLDPRSIDVERISGWITSLVLGFALFVGALIAYFTALRSPWWALALLVAWLLACAGLVWLAERYPYLDYEHTRYRVGPLGIEIRRGIWWRQVISVPRARIQHTDVAQGPIMRRFGVAKLVIHTAGTENASVELGGLTRSTALAIRDYLIRGGEGDGVDGV